MDHYKMQPKMHFYFAYGSNLDQAQMRRRCPDSALVGVASLAQHRLDFTRHSAKWQGGVADVVPDQSHTVWGLVYRLSPADLSLLDGYESYPEGYDRTPVDVRLPETKSIESAWVYYVAQKRPFMPPHPRYFGIIQTAASQWQFPIDYCRHLDQIARSSGYSAQSMIQAGAVEK